MNNIAELKDWETKKIDSLSFVIDSIGDHLKIYSYEPDDEEKSEFNNPCTSLYAKVISVDGVEALITSANLTTNGLRDGNIELGVLVKSEHLVSEIDTFFS